VIKFVNRLHSPTLYLRAPEEDVLLLCMRRQFTWEQLEQLRALLTKTLDWDYLLALADRHGITGILHDNLTSYFGELIPTSRKAALQNQYETLKMTNLILVTELRRTLRLFADEGIPAVPLKGPLLAFMVYKNPLWRECSDLDILVHKEHLENAQQLLESVGYQTIDLGKRKLIGLKAAIEEDYHVSLKHSRSGIVIELHWSVVTTPSLFEMDAHAFWANLTTITSDGVSFLTPAPEDLLLILAVHGVKHRWYQLKWLYDIAEFIYRYPEIDWQKLICKAEHVGVRRIALLNLWMAHSLLQVALPNSILEYIESDEIIKPGSVYVSSWIFSGAKSWLDRAKSELFCIDAWETIDKKFVYVCSYALASASSKESAPLRVFFGYLTANVIWLGAIVYRHLMRKPIFSA
jgi:hypothetical protein